MFIGRMRGYTTHTVAHTHTHTHTHTHGRVKEVSGRVSKREIIIIYGNVKHTHTQFRIGIKQLKPKAVFFVLICFL